MGVYLNPRNGSFEESVEREIYVDKSLLIERTFTYAKRTNKFICISRPRRFGKSTDANMLTAFYSKGCDSRELFAGLKIAQTEMYEKHINQHQVIRVDIQMFLSLAHDMGKMISYIEDELLDDLKKAFPNLIHPMGLCATLNRITADTGEKFIFIIDEWDCIFREFKDDREAQKQYLDYLRLLFKEQPYVEMVYMTGILPIKKYGTHSTLNMFDEISMLDSAGFSEFMGFTEDEVKALCEKYGRSFAKMQEWYDGYHLEEGISIYSPRSVTCAVNRGKFASYWSQTETYEALRAYIDLNMDGLKDAIVRLLAGESLRISTLSFQNDMSTFHSRDDVLTLLVHLGYLSYCSGTGMVSIPNNEVKDTFIVSVANSDWPVVTKLFQNANALLEATWDMDGKKVAACIQNSHYETSILQYNDENALAYTVYLAYITAKEYYTIVRELPAGRGFADLAFIPKGDRPALLIELKFDKDARSGIRQICDREYFCGLEHYLDRLLLVSVNYDRQTKEHECEITKYMP